MKYRVFWSPDAEEEFDGILQRSTQSAQIAAAARAIDAELVRNPLDFGESRHEAVRIGFVLPLAIHFEVLEDVRTVIVHAVSLVKKRR